VKVNSWNGGPSVTWKILVKAKGGGCYFHL
jgi:hypothetical protein